MALGRCSARCLLAPARADFALGRLRRTSLRTAPATPMSNFC